jgi:hypothetical protein
MDVAKRSLAATLLVDLAAALAFFGVALFRFSAGIALPSFSLRWELCEAALLLFHWLPALHFLAFALALGSAPRKAEVIASILPAAVLSALFASAILLGGPAIEKSRASMEGASKRFNASLEESRAELQAGKLMEARKAFAVAASIDDGDPRVATLEKQLSGAELNAAQNMESVATPSPQAVAAQPEAATEYYRKALEYYGKRDFFSANWYASEAARIDPRLADAAKLAARAWKEAFAQGGDPDDRKRAAFYTRKLDAYSRLRAQDYLEAYRFFSVLSGENKADPDVKKYLEESRAGLESVAYFKDEATRALASTVYPRFFAAISPAKDPARAGEKPLLVLAAREAGFTPSAAFFTDVEFLDSSGSTAGSPGLRIRAEGAKLSGGRLFFISVERDRPSIRDLPAWDLPAGTAGPGSSLESPPLEAAPASVAFPLSPSDAFLVAASRTAPESLGVVQLFQAAGNLPRFGLDPAPLILELLRRLGLPFALLASAILGAFVGGRFRMPEGRPRPASWLALPLMAAVSALAFMAVDRVDGLISLFTTRLLPGLAALWASAGIRAAFLLIVIVLAATLGSGGAARPAGERGDDEA